MWNIFFLYYNSTHELNKNNNIKIILIKGIGDKMKNNKIDKVDENINEKNKSVYNNFSIFLTLDLFSLLSKLFKKVS